RLLLDLGIHNSEFIFVDPNEGGAFERFEKIVPRISDAAPYMRRLLDLGAANKVFGWNVRYVPLCHFKGYLGNISEIREANTFHTEHVAPEFTNSDVVNSRKMAARAKTPRCNGCALYDVCEGIWITYLKNYGDKELKPVK
ncbi:MAG: hypothetical protein NTW04_03725, partial [Elusimicrobia bacterium]|nr:hypothetical protein [Elusimicrobiota bacterium]